jgi:hypothetical protein
MNWQEEGESEGKREKWMTTMQGEQREEVGSRL